MASLLITHRIASKMSVLSAYLRSISAIKKRGEIMTFSPLAMADQLKIVDKLIRQISFESFEKFCYSPFVHFFLLPIYKFLLKNFLDRFKGQLAKILKRFPYNIITLPL
jgi:hypothetical protein